MPSDLPIPVPLENASNLRDLGGWPTADGRRVRTGLVFRAPALVGLSAADARAVAALGIRTVCDFRGVRESGHNPVLIDGARTHAKLPIEPSVGAGLKDIMRTGAAKGHVGAEDMLELLREAYQAYALQSFAQYRAMFALLLSEDGLPLLMHCSAGKDRTGFGAALLLTALGVGWDDVLADYMATNRLWRREIASTLELPKATRDALLSAHATLLMSAFSAVNGAYGSVDAYLAQAIGLDAKGRADLQARLTL